MSEKPNSRDSILDAAARLFFSQGYHATGISQVIKESECPKGSVYYYFPEGKEQIAFECILNANQFISLKMRSCFKQAGSFEGGMRLFIDEMIAYGEKVRFSGFTPFSFWVAAETSCISEKLRDASVEVFSNWRAVIAEQLDADGVTPQHAEEIALLVISLLEGSNILASTFQNKLPLLTVSKHLDFIKYVIMNSQEEQ
ncbi:TetR/AcrR family transcriptional regulator [Paenibacillaceae bacterium]|nr:TetR/AcrR family transcriptional regulator [Paenibacillaceae bacterium]